MFVFEETNDEENFRIKNSCIAPTIPCYIQSVREIFGKFSRMTQNGLWSLLARGEKPLWLGSWYYRLCMFTSPSTIFFRNYRHQLPAAEPLSAFLV